MKHLVLLLVLLLSVSPVLAEEAVVTEDAVISPALTAHLEEIEAYVREYRGLETLAEVERRFPARAVAAAELIEKTLEEITPEDRLETSRFYSAFGFLPYGTDYLEAYLGAVESQVAGYYDSETKVLTTLLLGDAPLGDKLPFLESMTHSHEYTHALQDQHFGLDSLLDEIEAADHAMAVLALVEGDATMVMSAYLQELMQENPLLVAMQVLAEGASTGTLTVPEGMPDIVMNELMWSYTAGQVFVEALYAEGGWEAVNAAYANPPVSSEQILHPEKYLAGEMPIPVTLNPVDLGPDWVEIYTDTFGEFYLAEYLKLHLSERVSNRAVRGWGGDQFSIYYNETLDELAWVLKLTWDTPEDGIAFEQTLADYGAARFDGAVLDDTGCWNDESGALCVQVLFSGQVISSANTLPVAQTLAAGQ